VGDVTMEFGSEFQTLTTRLEKMHPWQKVIGVF